MPIDRRPLKKKILDLVSPKMRQENKKQELFFLKYLFQRAKYNPYVRRMLVRIATKRNLTLRKLKEEVDNYFKK